MSFAPNHPLSNLGSCYFTLGMYDCLSKSPSANKRVHISTTVRHSIYKRLLSWSKITLNSRHDSNGPFRMLCRTAFRALNILVANWLDQMCETAIIHCHNCVLPASDKISSFLLTVFSRESRFLMWPGHLAPYFVFLNSLVSYSSDYVEASRIFQIVQCNSCLSSLKQLYQI